MAEWEFERKRRSQKARDPMQASFFTNSSIDDDTHALVREAVQNSLDAKIPGSSKPVRVRFILGENTANSKVMEGYIPDEAWRHFNADDNGLISPPTKEDDCRYLVYEDFNTTGLLGDERASDIDHGNLFYYFLRAEGQSGKDEGDRGRHGIGKYVFPYTSRIRMFLAATVRSSDGRCLIAGQSVLKSHTVDGSRYTPDAWWGEFEEEEDGDRFQLPVEDESLLLDLRRDFKLERTEAESGLSIVMPYVDSETTVDKISEHLITEYFFPILKGQLVAEIVEGDEARVINELTLKSNLNGLLPEEKSKKLEPYVKVAMRSLDHTQFQLVELSVPEFEKFPRWDKEYLGQSESQIIKRELTKPDGLVCIRAPLFVLPASTGKTTLSNVDLYIARDPEEGIRKPLFVREGITIPEDRVSTHQGYTCIAVIEKGGLATLLGDSENPAHTEWEKNSPKFRGKYKWGAKTIEFVRLSFNKIFKLLSQADEDEDFDVLADIFYIDLPENDEEVPDIRKRRKKTKESQEGEPKPDVDISGQRPKYYSLSKLSNGFCIKGVELPLEESRKFVVRVAYDFVGASKSSALGKYHENDFNFSQINGDDNPISINAINIEEWNGKGQQLNFIAVDNSFDLRVTGFDGNRDIIVDVKSERIVGEEI